LFLILFHICFLFAIAYVDMIFLTMKIKHDRILKGQQLSYRSRHFWFDKSVVKFPHIGTL